MCNLEITLCLIETQRVTGPASQTIGKSQDNNQVQLVIDSADSTPGAGIHVQTDQNVALNSHSGGPGASIQYQAGSRVHRSAPEY